MLNQLNFKYFPIKYCIINNMNRNYIYSVIPRGKSPITDP